MAKQYKSKKIRALLTDGFSEQELRILCYDIPGFKSLYNQLAKATDKTEIIQQLLEYAEQKELTEPLLDYAKMANPAKYEKYYPYEDDCGAGDGIYQPRIQMYLQGDFSSLSSERRAAAIEALAALMGISPQAIEVYRISAGSIVFDLGVPPDAFQRLRFLLQSNSGQLRLLKIEKVLLEKAPGEIEEWIIKGGKFALVTPPAPIPGDVHGQSHKTKYRPWSRSSRENTTTAYPNGPQDLDCLENYFTDVEHLRALFQEQVTSTRLAKRLLVIHGVGGVGKSSLLCIFRLYCRKLGVPVALASGDEARSAAEVLQQWAAGLKASRVNLPHYSKTAEYYRVVQARVTEQVRQARQARQKTAGALARTLVGAAASTIPVVGPVLGSLGELSADALVDWLGSFLNKPDIDLLLDPTRTLTDDFLAGLEANESKPRLVLLLDTFEQISTLEDWTRNLVQRLPPNVLLVIAGRAIPHWSRHWPGWFAQAEVHELKPMTDTVMRELVRRFYATVSGSGEPDPEQVEAIISFARGLPLVVTSAVQLWVQYKFDNFQAIKPQVMADLVDRLEEGVPAELVPVLEAAAAVRWFNKEVLRAVTRLADVNVAFDELRQFPFTRSHKEGFALHSAVRESIDENLRLLDPLRHRELHERAAAYFEAELGQVGGETAERLELERLYHRIRADEAAGMRLFQEQAGRYDAYQSLNRLRMMLNDANTYDLVDENGRLWREYYNTRLAYIETRKADVAPVYEMIGHNKQAEPKLRAYALCDLAQILSTNTYLRQPGGIERALAVLEQCRELAPQLDAKLVWLFWHWRRIYTFQGEQEKAIEFLKQQFRFFEEKGDQYGMVYTLGLVRHAYAVLGDWKKSMEAAQQGLPILAQIPENNYLRIRLIGYSAWGLIWSGRYAEASREIRKAYDFSEQVGDPVTRSYYLRDLGLALGLQQRYTEAAEHLAEAIQQCEQRGEAGFREKGVAVGFQGAVLLAQANLDEAQACLEASLGIKQEWLDNPGIPELYNWLGRLHEVRARQSQGKARRAGLNAAEAAYTQGLTYRWTSRRYFECGLLTGLARVKFSQGQAAALPALLAEAEQLAGQYEYNDHLASLRLIQGHLAWQETNDPAAALPFYRQALIYALRYNRFLLDETLGSSGASTPLTSLIPYCWERGKAGRLVLAELRQWWQSGLNDVGTARPDTVAPLPEGIPLLEAERLARTREPGDGSPQQTVLDQLAERGKTKFPGQAR